MMKQFVLCILSLLVPCVFSSQFFVIDGKYFHVVMPNFYTNTMLCGVSFKETYNGVFERYLYRNYYDDRSSVILDHAGLSIQNGTLYLDSIWVSEMWRFNSQEIPLSLFWPGSKAPVEASWFSDTLRLTNTETSGEECQYIIIFKKGKVTKMGKRICRSSLSNCEQDSVFAQLNDFDSDDKILAGIDPCIIFIDNAHQYDSCSTLLPSLEETRTADSLEREERKKLPKLEPLYKPYLDSLGLKNSN